MEDIAYKKMVTDNLENDSSEVFGNFTTTHAKFIITSFIESAQESISILSGSFNDAFYDGNEIFDSLEKAANNIKKEGAIRIITVEQKSLSLMRHVEEINQKIGIQVIIYISASYSGTEKLRHFMLVDGKRYRIEDPHDRYGHDMPPSVKAVVCCNKPEIVKNWQIYFDSTWKNLLTQLPANG